MAASKNRPMSATECEREMKRHRTGYQAYQAARALTRSAKTARDRKAAAAEQEQHRPAYTAYKRAYARSLALRKEAASA